MTRKGDWMETFTGRKFYPLDPRPEDVCIEDIAHSLSLLCRFGGHVKHFYSVAQHCCYVADVVYHRDSRYVLEALLHDAAEAYIGDVIRPIKRSLPLITEVEMRLETVIATRYGLDYPMPSVVKWADNVMLRNEHAQLMHGRNEWPSCDQAEGPDVTIIQLEPKEAETMFLARFDVLRRR